MKLKNTLLLLICLLGANVFAAYPPTVTTRILTEKYLCEDGQLQKKFEFTLVKTTRTNGFAIIDEAVSLESLTIGSQPESAQILSKGAILVIKTQITGQKTEEVVISVAKNSSSSLARATLIGAWDVQLQGAGIYDCTIQR